MTTSEGEQGVIYAAAGKGYVSEAAASARSLRACVPGVHVTLFTDVKDVPDVFDIVEPITDPSFSFLDKVRPMRESPYQRTLYLDTDTFVGGDISEMFLLLDRFDLAAAHAPQRITSLTYYQTEDREVPPSFPEYNSGVMLYRKSPAVDRVLEQWGRKYAEFEHVAGDQSVLRAIVYLSDLRVATLTPEYNCRVHIPTYLKGPVRILHARVPNPEQVIAELNQAPRSRVYIPGKGVIAVDKPLS